MHNTTALRRCTVQSKCHNFCDAPSIADAPFPVCSHHAIALFRFMADALDGADDLTRTLLGFEELDETRARRFRAERKARTKPGIVYYLMVDGLVKIGYTDDLARRLADYPPTAQLLATEPGDTATEAARHAQFAGLLTARREWFTPGPALRDHTEGLADFRAA